MTMIIRFLLLCAGLIGLVICIIFNDTNFCILQCPLFNTFGIYCLGCGGTRAINCLLHGNLLEAISFNPFMFVFLPLGCFVFIQTKCILSLIESASSKTIILFCCCSIFFVLALTVARNIFFCLQPKQNAQPVSYTHLTLPTNREV